MMMSVVCDYHLLLPFPFGWLLVGELSSIPLNVRWMLIQISKSAQPSAGRNWTTRYTTVVNYAFAITFFASRVVVYGLGLAHLLRVRDELFGLRSRVASPLLYLVLGLLVGGYVLNLMWMRKIVQMAVGGGKQKHAD